MEPMTRALLYALLIATFVWGGAWAMMIAVGLWWLRLIMQLSVINTAAYRLGGRLFGIEVVAYDIALPLISLWILLTQRFRKKHIYW